ncbi:MAG: hypothetical protein HOV81_30440, partial [Kofleriaceae bacterium]|nr:hypothetical protein [Kofleriaceae bacterium]
MKVVPFRCPNCGAQAQPSTAAVLRCEYCGVASRVQRTTVMPPAPVPPRLAHEHAAHPAPRASQSAGVMLAVTGGCVAAVVAGAIAFTTLRTDREVARLTAGEPATQAGPRKRGWQATAPILADLTGDAVQDIVG